MDEREQQIENICGKNAKNYDIDCWRSIIGITIALESWNLNVVNEESKD